MRSRLVAGIAIAFLVLALLIVMTWYFPRYVFLIPKRVQDWMYPIDKNNLDLLRFLHFLALAIVTVHFIPMDWPGLKSRWLKPMILCGQHSLEIFCLGILLSFIGHFVTSEVSRAVGIQILISVLGIIVMVASCVADYVVQHYRGARFRESSETAAGGPRGRRGMKSLAGALIGICAYASRRLRRARRCLRGRRASGAGRCRHAARRRRRQSQNAQCRRRSEPHPRRCRGRTVRPPPTRRGSKRRCRKSCRT